MLNTPYLFTTFCLLALANFLAFADPSPLQDFCVGINDLNAAVFVNGRYCKNPKMVTSEDFVFRGLNIPRSPTNQVGSTVTRVNVDLFPGLNTLGISLERVDYAPNGGLNPPHTHPRATEVLTCLEGTLYVGFVDSNNRLFSTVLHAGDVFIIPIGMIHFQMNLGETPAAALSSLSSQNPGLITIENAVFGSEPPIKDDVLARAFQLDKETVDLLQSKLRASNLRST